MIIIGVNIQATAYWAQSTCGNFVAAQQDCPSVQGLSTKDPTKCT